MSRPVALVTGASSGIGRELALVFADNGYDLIVTARRQKQLKELAAEVLALEGPSCKVHVIPVDLAKVKGPRKLAAAVAELDLGVDVLINNAGVADSGSFTQMKRDRALDIVNVNVRALTELTLRFAKSMAQRGSGRILNVASVVAFQPIPSMAVYSASKAFVLSLTESLSEELRGSGVSVSALCPGLTKTEMVAQTEAAELMPEMLMSDARDVAEQGYRACLRGEVICIPGLLNQAFVGWTQTQPRWAYRLLSGLAARSTLLRGARP